MPINSKIVLTSDVIIAELTVIIYSSVGTLVVFLYLHYYLIHRSNAISICRAMNTVDVNVFINGIFGLSVWLQCVKHGKVPKACVLTIFSCMLTNSLIFTTGAEKHCKEILHCNQKAE